MKRAHTQAVKPTVQKEIFRSIILYSALVIISLGCVFSILVYRSEFSKATAVIGQTNLAISLFIDQYFMEAIHNIHVLSRQEDIRNAPFLDATSHQRVRDLYLAYAQANSDIVHIYSGYAGGLMLINDWEAPEGYDPTLRPWYQTAIALSPETAIGIPFQEINTREWVISTSRALISSDGIDTGVVCIEYSIGRIAQLIAQRDAYTSGYSFVVNDSGKIILHHDESFIERVILEISDAIAAEQEGLFSYSLDQTGKIAYFRRLQSTGWSIVTVVNRQEVLQPIFQGVGMLIFFTALVAIILGLAQSIQMGRRFTQPLIRLGNRIESVIAGLPISDNPVALPRNEIDRMSLEIGQIAEKELYQKNLELQRSEKKYRSLFDQTHDSIFLISLEGRIMTANQRGQELLGYSLKELERMNVDQISIELEESQGVMQRLQAGEKIPLFERQFRRKDGRIIHVEIRADLVRDDQGKPLYIQSLTRDVTERKQKEAKIQFMSFRDSLTGLYNRRYLEEEMERLDQSRQLPICLIMADLNGLKQANDFYGHAVGDQMLKKSAQVFREACRKEDIIARWGGDEFVIFLPSTTEEEGYTICNRIQRIASEKTQPDENNQVAAQENLPISMALGLAVKTHFSQSLPDLLIQAENHMYEQKPHERRTGTSVALHALLRILEAKSLESLDHIRNMEEYAQKLAHRLKLSQAEWQRAQLLISLHDVGHMDTPEDILRKKEALTEEEWEQIRKHPERGYQIAQSSEEFSSVAEEIRCHHERWDGSGYPRGISGEAIPFLSRALAIVDAYDVMRRGRPYRPPKTKEEALEELRKEAGSHFDPKLSAIFLELMRKESVEK